VAQIPTTLNLQGHINDVEGNPINSTNANFTFRLFTVQTGGTPIYDESINTVEIVGGYFNLTIGPIAAPVLIANCKNPL
jgi:hypothetical protein